MRSKKSDLRNKALALSTRLPRRIPPIPHILTKLLAMTRKKYD